MAQKQVVTLQGEVPALKTKDEKMLEAAAANAVQKALEATWPRVSGSGRDSKISGAISWVLGKGG
eukprot:6265352-Karenia_brevis.AAC.1